MKFLLILLGLTFAMSSFAQRNPQIRVCNLNDGRFWTLDVEYPSQDNVGFCRFDVDNSTAMVGSISLMKYFWGQESSKAVSAFLDTQNTDYKSCKAAGSKRIIGSDSEGGVFELCYFDDFSFILKRTLTLGWDAKENRRLVNSLSK